jgi:hypothetical protein
MKAALGGVKSERKQREVGRQIDIHEATVMKGLKLNFTSVPKMKENHFYWKTRTRAVRSLVEKFKHV